MKFKTFPSTNILLVWSFYNWHWQYNCRAWMPVFTAGFSGTWNKFCRLPTFEILMEMCVWHTDGQILNFILLIQNLVILWKLAGGVDGMPLSSTNSARGLMWVFQILGQILLWGNSKLWSQLFFFCIAEEVLLVLANEPVLFKTLFFHLVGGDGRCTCQASVTAQKKIK